MRSREIVVQSGMDGRADAQLARNIGIHDRIARRYDRRHHEIFNDREQDRLVRSLDTAISSVRSAHGAVRALDFGCGSGNLTRHLVAAECRVTAVDISPGFLDLVGKRFAAEGVETSRLNGRDLSQFGDRSFDLIATYSVLHHIPDYLAAVEELGRVCKVGGVVYIDHEASDQHWLPNPLYREFRQAAERTDWSKFLKPRNYYGKVRRLFDPKFANEGDIHVWPDDHIEWRRIADVLGNDFEVVLDDSYLLYSSLYDAGVFDRYKDRLNDTRVMAWRRIR